MSKIAVSDTGPLLHLTEIGHTHLFTLFPSVIISSQVEAELTQYEVCDHIMSLLTNQLIVVEVEPHEIVAQQKALAGFKVQPTDTSVAALAAKYTPVVVLTDDLELRKGLEAQGYFVTGSVGVLIRAFKTQQLTKNELYTLLDQLFDGSTLYLRREFYEHVRQLLNRLTP